MSRLFRDLREEKGLVNQIGVSNMTQTHQGVFYISAALPAENISAVEQAIAEQIKIIQTEPIAAKDIERIRTQVANRFVFANERQAIALTSMVTTTLSYRILLLLLIIPSISKPSLPQIFRATAQKYLNPEAYGVVVMKPA